MNKKILEKYHIIQRVISTHYYVQSNPNCLEILEKLPLSDMLIAQLPQYEMSYLKDKFNNKTLINNDLDMVVHAVCCQYNDGIGVEVETFWYAIFKQNLGIKRKNDRLRKILKKQHLTVFEDIAIFLPNIEVLLQSEIFKIVYTEEEQQAIFDLVEKIKRDWISFVEKIIKRDKFKDIIEMNHFYNKILNFEWHRHFFQITDSQLVSYQEFYKKQEFIFP